MGSSSFFNNPPVGDVIDEGGQGNSFYDNSPAYTEIDPVAIENFVAEAEAAAAASEVSHQASQTSANASTASAAAALISETNALASKNAAATSATNAGISETNALSSKNAASTSATNAGTSEVNAASSASAAAGSASAASTSASNAASSATAANTSKVNAGTSETNAAASATAAATSATNAASAVQAAAGTVTPLIDGTAAVGTGTKWAREDHKHPTDTTRAPLASPALTGTPTAPTAVALTNTTQVATTAYADAAVGVEKSRAQAAEALLAPLASPALTGVPTAPTAAAGNNTVQIATTAFVSSYAPLASPALSGTPTAPTAPVGTNTLQLATTAFVLANSSSAGRALLSANRTYFVRTDGSNSNDGLSNTAGGAFLTIQKAIDTACGLDLSIYSVTITVGAGTFAGANTLKPYVGAGPITIAGAGNTTIVSAASDNAFFGSGAGVWNINSMKLTTTTSGYGIFLSGITSVGCTGLEVGACGQGHFRSSAGARLRLFAYTISGSAPLHYLCEYGAGITCVSVTVTLTGTPAFSSLFASCSKLGIIDVEAVTWSGSATGTRYLVNTNAVINSVGGTLPGSVAGSSATGGQYT